jgi:hypothetical protein
VRGVGTRWGGEPPTGGALQPASRSGRASLAAASAFALAALLGGPAAAQGIAIEALAPARADSLLVCTVSTRGLPDPRSRETLESGLPSSLVVAFSLIDGEGEERDGSRSEIQIEPDLWEEIVVIRSPLADRRVGSMDEVAAALGALGPLPVVALDRVPASTPLRLRVRVAVHPLARSERERVHALFSGDGDASGSNRREVSVGLGSLVSYFLGEGPDEDWVAEATSPPFTREALTGAAGEE